MISFFSVLYLSSSSLISAPLTDLNFLLARGYYGRTEGAGTRSSLPFFSVADHDKAPEQHQRISRQTKADKAASLEAYLRGVEEPFHLDHENYCPCARLLCSHRPLLLALALLALCLPSLALASLVGSQLIGLTLPIHLLWHPLLHLPVPVSRTCSVCLLCIFFLLLLLHLLALNSLA
jgi:hypothetical protein